MNKYLRGFLGEVRDCLDYGGKLTLSNLKYYDYLKQVLDHFHYEDDSYNVHYWDLTQYNMFTNPDYTGNIIKTTWINSIDIYKTNLVISLELGVSSGKREIFVRQFAPGINYLFTKHPDVLTPAELDEGKDNVHLFDKKSGSYSKGGKIYYLIAFNGIRRDANTGVFDYTRSINKWFEYKIAE